MDWLKESEISHDVRRIAEVVNSGILNPENADHPLVWSAFTEVVICLNDLLQKCDDNAGRVAFTDSIVLTPKVNDVTSLVREMRNAVCHMTSGLHNLPEGSKYTFNRVYGQMSGVVVQAQTVPMGLPDDMCFQFGLLQIGVKHHIVRAYREAEKVLSPLMSKPL